MADEDGPRAGGPRAETGVPDPVGAELARALARDLDAGFAEVVHVHRDLLYSVARRFVPDAAEAEDLAAESLLRAYRALCGYATERIESLAVRPWLLTILRNTARNRARDVARRPGPPPRFEPVADPSAEAGPAEQAERHELQHMLGSALGALTEVQRTAVVLRHVQGLPTSEVALTLGCKEGTAKSHISRGLARLREVLGRVPSLVPEGPARKPPSAPAPPPVEAPTGEPAPVETAGSLALSDTTRPDPTPEGRPR